MNLKLLLGLALLNGALSFALLAGSAEGPVLPFGIFDCCQSSSAGPGYCCRDCCWFTSDCERDADCTDA